MKLEVLHVPDCPNLPPMLERLSEVTDLPVTITTTSGHTGWEPAEAVVFIGADAGGGPSADCCCDYLNFFTDQATAEAWTRSNPGVPGQILNQTQAEDLGTRLFQPLLAE